MSVGEQTHSPGTEPDLPTPLLEAAMRRKLTLQSDAQVRALFELQRSINLCPIWGRAAESLQLANISWEKRYCWDGIYGRWWEWEITLDIQPFHSSDITFDVYGTPQVIGRTTGDMYVLADWSPIAASVEVDEVDKPSPVDPPGETWRDRPTLL